MLIVAVLLGASLVGAGASPGSAADSGVSLGLETFEDIAVDDAHGRLFFSQGWGHDGVLVTTMDGTRVAMITDMPGAYGLALNADGSRLYVGLGDAHAISVVDTESLTEIERYSTGADTCPSDVAVTGSQVWYGYGCTGWPSEGGLGSIDLSSSPPALRTWPDSSYYAAPILSLASGRLAIGEPGTDVVRTYDISSGEPVTLSLGRDVGANLQDLHVTRDGEHVITASGSPYEHPVWRTEDLSPAGVYGSEAYPAAATTPTDGSLVGIGTANSDIEVRIYQPGGVEPIETWDLAEGPGQTLGERGLAFSADASRLFAVTTEPFSENPQLFVLDSPGVSGSSLTLSVPPGAEPGRSITVSGRLSFTLGGQPGVQNLVVTIDNRAGHRQTDVATDSTGAYSFSDRLSYGVTKYTVTYPGDRWHEPASRTAEARIAGRPGDLDLDGDADLVVGAIGEDIGARWDVGSVIVLRGAASGVSGVGAREFTQNTPGVPDTAETGDQFGFASTQGDFNGDEFPEVAVSAPGEDFSGMHEAGAVTVLPGTAAGPAAGQAYELTSLLVHPHADNDEFGTSLAAADFNGDGFDDLAVGAPGTNALMVFPGSANGLDKTAGVMWDQDILPGESGNFPDEFGRTLATGDVNADGFDDLAVGAPQDNEDRGYASGSVTMVYGSDQGLTEVGAQRWSRDSPGVLDQPRPFNWNRGDLPDDFGAQVNLADYDGDGYADLAVGAPGAPLRVDGSRRADAGSVSILYGSAGGITSRDQLLAQGRLGIPGVPGADDRFGAALATGDVHDDGRSDLAVTSAGERIVTLLKGAAEGLGLARAKRYGQETPGVPGTDERRDRFGESLRFAPLDGDRFDDLAVGVPGESSGRGGAVILYARDATGLATKRAGSISQASPGVPGAAERNDWFGFFDRPGGS